MTKCHFENFDEMSFYTMSDAGKPVEFGRVASLIMDGYGRVIIGESPYQVIFDRGSITIGDITWQTVSPAEAMFRAILKLGGNDAINND